MKKSTLLSIGILVLMLTVGGIAYGEGSMDSSSDQQGTMGSDPGMSSGTGGMGQSSGQQGTAGMSQSKIDINTASIKELESVPGMTSSMAKDIVKYRDQNGPFASVDDLTKVKGVDNKKLDMIRNNVTIGQQGMGGSSGTGGTGMGTGGTGTDGMGTGESSGTGGTGTGSSGY